MEVRRRVSGGVRSKAGGRPGIARATDIACWGAYRRGTRQYTQGFPRLTYTRLPDQ